ncbi:hypothetical protein K2173_026433 [Erythroxylum novogranatense]|uniref:DELLA protein RGL1 n=1 Tax=Erythroxylum novogranatense TaxID=1862640 RepID=A0AAV8TXI8_9ROSI|nr:hypothetical protein K2173_026433 [Erythroxylum novogranatense]
MAFSLLSNEFDNETGNEMSRFNLSLSAMACYPYPFFPMLDNNDPAKFLPFPEEVQHPKRVKRTASVADFNENNGSHFSGGSSSSSDSNSMMSRSKSVNSLPKLHFRDHIWAYSQRYHAAEAIEEAASDVIGTKEIRNEEDDSANEIRLVQLLISCAEAVACRDKTYALTLLSELRSNTLVFGSSFQRVASCFVQGLAERLSLLQTLGSIEIVEPVMNIMDVASDRKEEALSLVYEICPHIRFGHFVANSSILEAFEGESYVHVVDLGMTLGLPYGHQWRRLLQILATRAAKQPNQLRITSVGLCVERFRVIGDELEKYAKELGIDLEFTVVESNLENLRPEDIKIKDGEVLVVNSILQLHNVVKESRGALNYVLRIIHKLSPKVLVLVEQDSNHNGPFFLGRFMEALHYYSAIFDSLDAMLPKYDTRRTKIEQFYFAEEIKNIVSCEGPSRVERHERVDQWRRRMSRAGFQAAPIKMLAQAKQWIGNIKACDGYTVVEEKGCLVLGWKSRPIIAASCWKC